MERVADTVTPQPICAVVAAVDVTLESLLARPGGTDEAREQGAAAALPPPLGRLWLVCVDVRDPGAFATLVRLVSDGDDAGASEKAAAVVAAATEAVAAADEAEVTADAERSDESEVSEEAAS